jgi:hypothetical protein
MTVADEAFGPWEPAPYDEMLERLVAAANGGEFSMGVTLTVGGAVITGDLVGGEAWLDALVQRLETSPRAGMVGQGLATELRKRFTPTGEELNDELNHPLQYIHLMNATAVTGLGGNPNGLWRVRVAEVTAWTLGTLRLPES